MSGTRGYDVMRLLRLASLNDIVFQTATAGDGVSATPAERAVHLVEGYIREVHHGGHEFWYGSAYGAGAAETPGALRSAGFPALAAICKRSFAVFPGGAPPDDPDELERVHLDEWLGDDPNGVLPVLSGLDDELYACPEVADANERCVRFILENLPDFGGDPATAPAFERICERDREMRAQRRERDAKRRARGAATPSRPERPVSEREVFRYAFGHGWWPVLQGIGLVLLGGAAGVWGRAGSWKARAAAVVLPLAGAWLIVQGARRLGFRVVFDPAGVHVSGHPTIPWTAITGYRDLSFVGETGFEVLAESGGAERRVRVPGEIANFDHALTSFKHMTGRHGSPWSLATLWRADDSADGDAT